MNIRRLLLATFTFLALSATAFAAVSIAIKDFTITPMTFPRDAVFELHVTVNATDVPVVSYVLRTARPVKPGGAPMGFDHYDKGRQLAFMQEAGQVHLQDNGVHDLDSEDHAFRIRIDTKEWPQGKHELVLFAHNRPGKGRHIKDYREFAVVIGEKEVQVVELGKPGAARFTRCEVIPPSVASGDTVAVQVAWAGGAAEGIEVRQPFYVRPEQSPAPFTYDDKHVSVLLDAGKRLIRDNGTLDTQPEIAAMTLSLDTTGWMPGLYFLELRLPNRLGQADLRHAVIRVAAPEDRLDVQVPPSWPMMPGTHADRMARMADGTLVHTTHFSTDGGRIWHQRESGTIGSGSVQLRDGRILGMGYRKLPIEGREGWYSGKRYGSTDNGRTVHVLPDGEFHVPQAKAAHGHAPHPGPLYMRSIVERPDGRLVALMAGWFKGDDTPCPYNPRRPYSRTYTCISEDSGATWAYLSTIGYDFIGSEGYNEGAMELLPDGRLIAALRTGNMRDPNCQDNPIMVAFSEDGGATWSAPQRTGMHGAFPDLAVLSDGLIALSYGRPGAVIAFSRDNGRSWTDATPVDVTPYSGYTSICEIAPGELLMAFGTKDRVDPATSERSDGIRIARIQYRDKNTADPLNALKEAGVSMQPLGEGFYEGTMHSNALGHEEHFTLHLPEGYTTAPAQPYPLIVFLHGLGRHHKSLLDFPASRETIKRSPAVVLLPNGRASWWVDSPVNPESNYASYLEECIALVSGALPVSSDRKERAIGGWSMGGFGSANYAQAHPEAFGAWGGIIALLDFPNAQYSKENNHSVPGILGNEDQQAAVNPLLRIDALRDSRIVFFTADAAFDRMMNETFAATLTELEIPHTFITLNGGHTIDVVLEAFPQVFDFFQAGFSD